MTAFNEKETPTPDSNSDQRFPLDELLGVGHWIEEPSVKLVKRIVRAHLAPDLIAWGQRFLPHYFRYPPSLLHTWLAAELRQLHPRQGRHRAIIAPRSGAKTTWVSKLFPLYCVCHELEKYILLVSDSTDQARQNLLAIQDELLSNEVLAKRYPRAVGLGDVWNRLSLVTRNGIKIEALGAGKRLRGRTFGPHRPGLVVVDDLENDVAVRSLTQREKLWSWFNRALMFVGTADTNVLVVGTALHPDDLLQRLRRTPGWKVRTFRSLIAEPERLDLWDEWRQIFRDFEQDVDARESAAHQFYLSHQSEMDTGAVTLWPEVEPLHELMVYRETFGDLPFRSEKQGDPHAASAAEWPAEYFSESIWFHDWPETGPRVMALDPSKGGSEKNDFSALVMLEQGPDGRLFVEADLFRADGSQVVEHCCDVAATFRPNLFSIEINQFLQLFEPLFDEVLLRRRQLLSLQTVTQTVNKLVRIRTLTPYLRSGRFRFKSNSPGTQLLVEQLRAFPNAEHDDGPDALHMAVQLLSDLTRPVVNCEERAVA